VGGQPVRGRVRAVDGLDGERDLLVQPGHQAGPQVGEDRGPGELVGEDEAPGRHLAQEAGPPEAVESLGATGGGQHGDVDGGAHHGA
jgi:hypothetical protein